MVYLLVGLLGAISWLLILQRWRSGLFMLIGYLPFGGVIVLWSNDNPVMTLAKDLLFVLPLYLSFFLRGVSLQKARLPGSITIAVVALVIIVLAQMANPGVSSPLVALVGAKVWLFYVPLLPVTVAAITDADELRALLRAMIIFAPVPCVVGLIQFVGSSTFGHVETITAFYGDAAATATQNFSSFYYGARLYRLPSTFTSVAQYSGYLQATIIPAYCVARSDNSAAWRRYALCLLPLLIVAGLLSGARSAFIFIPAILVMILVADRVVVGAMTWIVTIPTILLLTLTVAGFDLDLLFGGIGELALKNATEFSTGTIVDALQRFPFGTGTGTNTNGARHVLSDSSALFGFESHYAKTIVELGIPGLLAMTSVYAIVIWRAWRLRHLAKNTQWASIAAAILAFLMLFPVHSLKGWPLDWEPGSVYFWILGGVMYALPRVMHSANSSDRIPHLAAVRLPRFSRIERPITQTSWSTVSTFPKIEERG
jgi:hypothetical protein